MMRKSGKTANKKTQPIAGRDKTAVDMRPVYVKCSGRGCDKKDSCYRYTIEDVGQHQPYFVESISIPDKRRCAFFVDVSHVVDGKYTEPHKEVIYEAENQKPRRKKPKHV